MVIFFHYGAPERELKLKFEQAQNEVTLKEAIVLEW